jgi:hypothetical protein
LILQLVNIIVYYCLPTTLLFLMHLASCYAATPTRLWHVWSCFLSSFRRAEVLVTANYILLGKLPLAYLWQLSLYTDTCHLPTFYKRPMLDCWISCGFYFTKLYNVGNLNDRTVTASLLVLRALYDESSSPISETVLRMSHRIIKDMLPSEILSKEYRYILPVYTIYHRDLSYGLPDSDSTSYSRPPDKVAVQYNITNTMILQCIDI